MWGGLESFTPGTPREPAPGEREGRKAAFWGHVVRSWGPASHHGAQRSRQTLQTSFTLGC